MMRFILKHILPVMGLAHYFEDILKNISSFNHYCVYGHLDYAARYIKDPSFEFHYRDYSDLLDAILRTDHRTWQRH